MSGKKLFAVAGIAAFALPAVAGAFVPILNAGFDTIENGRAEGWSVPGPAWRAEKGAGINGSGGFVYESDAGRDTPRPTQTVTLKPGRKYRISAFVTADGLKVDRESTSLGMTVLLSWSDGNGKWLGECQASPAARGKTDDWCRIEAITPDIPANAAQFRIAPYVNGHGIGKARIDNVAIETLDLRPVEVVSSSAYRNEATGGVVRFAATVNFAEDVGADGQTVWFVYRGRTGENVKVEGVRNEYGAYADIDVGGFAEGTNDVLAVLRAGNRTVGTGKMRFARLRELPKRRVRIDAKKRLIVDGRPFFPLGTYVGRMDPATIALFARSPFNCVGPYNGYSREQLDCLDSFGLKAIDTLCHAYGKPEKTVPRLKKIIEDGKDHPAVIAWYICDEPTLQTLPEMLERRKMIEEMDGGNHPIWGCLAVFTDVRHFLAAYDVLGIDPYPIPKTSVAKVTAAGREIRKGMFGIQPVWAVPQAFAWGWLGRRENLGQRAPTKLEMANMTWQAIANGANGIVYYSMAHITPRPGEIHEDADDQFDPAWARLCAAAAEVKAYERVLLSDGEPPAVASDNDQVVCRAWRDGDRVYLLVVNSTEEPQSATVSVSGTFSKIVNPEFGAAPRLVAPGKLGYELPAMGYVMLRLE